MMGAYMNKIKYACTILLPNLIIILYLLFLNRAEDYASTHYTIYYKITVQIIGNIIFGVYILFVCKECYSNGQSNALSKYILGVIIMPLIYLISLLPALKLSVIYFYLLDSIPYYLIFASIYIGLLIYSVYQKRRKALQKNEKDFYRFS